jgi:hypothetical protein
LSNGLLAQVKAKNKKTLEACFMPNARYFRDQASLCLEIARLMTDAQAAQNCRARASDHFAKAIELERTEPHGSEPVEAPHHED